MGTKTRVIAPILQKWFFDEDMKPKLIISCIRFLVPIFLLGASCSYENTGQENADRLIDSLGTMKTNLKQGEIWEKFLVAEQILGANSQYARHYIIYVETKKCGDLFLEAMDKKFGSRCHPRDANDEQWRVQNLPPIFDGPVRISYFGDEYDQPEFGTSYRYLSLAFYDQYMKPLVTSKPKAEELVRYFQKELDKIGCGGKSN